LSRNRSRLVGLLLLGALVSFGLCKPYLARSAMDSTPGTPPSVHSLQSAVLPDYGQLPLSFERNQGQTDRRVRFLARGSDSTLYLTPTEAVFTLGDRPQTVRTKAGQIAGRTQTPTAPPAAVSMQLVEADPAAVAAAEKPLVGKVNYFLGRDPRKWHSGVPTCARARFQQVYPGVDVVYYGNQRHLEYDFVVAPHADPQRIQLRFAGAQQVHVDRAGDLIVRVAGRTLTWRKPTVYQESRGGRQAVEGQFRMQTVAGKEPRIGFALARYDASRPLVIDPVLTYATYLGGSHSEDGAAITADNSGNAYVTGTTTSTDFPTTPGALQPASDPATNGISFVTKLNAAGTSLVYSTYLGGNNDTATHGIVVDSSGAAFVCGDTSSTNFPVTVGAYQTHTAALTTAFVIQLNPTGDSLTYSTLLGGDGGGYAEAFAVDGSGSAYVTGFTRSAAFPVTPGAFQTTHQGTGFNAFVLKLNPSGTALTYSTLLGGSADTWAYAIALDSGGNAYAVGQTAATDFPVTPGAFQTSNTAGTPGSGGRAAFVTKLNATGSSLLYSTYLTGQGGSGAVGVAVDIGGNAYVTGNAVDAFPVTAGAFQTTKASSPGFSSAFVTKLNPTGSAPVYSTYLGGSSETYSVGIVLDGSGNATIGGDTQAHDFPTTLGAFQRTNRAGSNEYNIFVTKLNPTGAALIYSTYLGGSHFDLARGLTLDIYGNVYIIGTSGSTDFPTNPGAYQLMNKTSLLQTVSVTKLSVVPFITDFNHDGHTDLLLQNAKTGQIAFWLMNGSHRIRGTDFFLDPSVNYALVGVGNFAGDNTSTLVLQNRGDDTIAFWTVGGADNATITGGAYVSPRPSAGWKVVGVADFNGDGRSDLVFQNRTTNQISIWFMNGPNYAGGLILPYTPPTGWQVAGVGDLNADGFPDLVFQNQSTGQIALWFMHGSAYSDGIVMSTLPAAGWKIVGVGDYNGDGYADLLFQNHATNQAAVWYLRGSKYLGGDLINPTPPSDWQIAGPR